MKKLLLSVICFAFMATKTFASSYKVIHERNYENVVGIYINETYKKGKGDDKAVYFKCATIDTHEWVAIDPDNDLSHIPDNVYIKFCTDYHKEPVIKEDAEKFVNKLKDRNFNAYFSGMEDDDKTAVVCITIDDKKGCDTFTVKIED